VRKTKNIEDVRQIFIDNDLELVSETYDNNHKPLVFKDKEGYYYYQPLNGLFIKRQPTKFQNTNPYILYNIKLYCKINNKPFELISDTYINAKDKLQWKCLKDSCNEIFSLSWNCVKNGKGCGFCCPTARQVGLSNCLATKNPKLAKEWHQTLNGDLTPYDVTCGSHEDVWWQCKDNPKHAWKAETNNRHGRGDGCPECSKSKGEKECKRIFDLRDIFYIPQKEFDDLLGLGGGKLSYDFYALEFNLLVEFQGIQHEKPVDFNGRGMKYAEEQFIIQREHDRRKKEYAEEHDYNLLEIWYWDFDRIEEIIMEKLLSISEENLKEVG